MFGNFIYCFTGTGNSLAVAKALSNRLNLTLKLITEEEIQKTGEINCNVCVLVFPSYAYGLPKPVRCFIKTRRFNVAYMATLVTYGSHSGGTLAEAIRLLKRRKQRVDYSAGIKSVENFAPIFGVPSWEKQEKRLLLHKKKTERVYNDINAREVNKRFLFRPLSSIVITLFRVFSPLLTKLFRVNKECNACGLCQKLCPVNAIKIKTKGHRARPVFKARKCAHCQACLQLCPQKAITFMRVRKHTRRYLNPEVNKVELIKR